MNNDSNLLTFLTKYILTYIKIHDINIRDKKILLIYDNKYYINFLRRTLEEYSSNITLATNDTNNLSSLFYDADIILIANNKKSSIGYGLIEDIDMNIENYITHNVNKPKAYIFDLNRHEKFYGNVQYNNPYERSIYKKLNNVELCNLNVV